VERQAHRMPLSHLRNPMVVGSNPTGPTITIWLII
jgi:hypothetical protein